MPALRFYYSDSIENFLRKPTNEIVGNLALAHAHDINQKTSMSWVEEIDILKSAWPTSRAEEVSILNTTSRVWDVGLMSLHSSMELCWSWSSRPPSKNLPEPQRFRYGIMRLT